MPETQTIDLMLQSVPEPMVRIDANGMIAGLNRAAEELLGDWASGRAYPTVLRQPSLLNRVEIALVQGTGGEARYVISDLAGETVFRVLLTPLSDPRIGMEGVILHFADISHLSEAEEMRRDFVANVTHELRTPLTAILGFIETLKGPAAEDRGVQERFLTIMEDEAQRMNRMISDLLSLSRVEAQERLRPSEDVNIATILKSVEAALRPMVEENNNRLLLDVPETGCILKGDRDQLTQVFMNLTENALKYGGAGRDVRVVLTEGQGSGSMKGEIVQVDVVDQGEGIDLLHLPRLTERFYRVDTHRNRAMGGTGLGLAIVKHIVNRHRGRLRISSESGQGSVFTVVLPKQ